VRTLAEKSMVNDGKLYWCVSSPTMKDKPVSIYLGSYLIVVYYFNLVR
jgi:hypothetical protein